jgi:hypothetical protein
MPASHSAPDKKSDQRPDQQSEEDHLRDVA